LYLQDSLKQQTSVKFYSGTNCISSLVLPLQLRSCDFDPKFLHNYKSVADIQVMMYEDTDILPPTQTQWAFQISEHD